MSIENIDIIKTNKAQVEFNFFLIFFLSFKTDFLKF